MKSIVRVFAVVAVCVVFVLGYGLTAEAATKFVSIATGGTGGTYYIIGGAMGKTIEKYVPEAKVSVESTAASTENCRRLASKQVKFAIVMPDSALLRLQRRQGIWRQEIPQHPGGHGRPHLHDALHRPVQLGDQVAGRPEREEGGPGRPREPFGIHRRGRS